MTVEEEVAELREKLDKLTRSVLAIETIAALLRNSAQAILQRTERLETRIEHNEEWLTSVSTIMRHCLAGLDTQTKRLDAIEERAREPVAVAPAAVTTATAKRTMEIA